MNNRLPESKRYCTSEDPCIKRGHPTDAEPDDYPCLSEHFCGDQRFVQSPQVSVDLEKEIKRGLDYECPYKKEDALVMSCPHDYQEISCGNCRLKYISSLFQRYSKSSDCTDEELVETVAHFLSNHYYRRDEFMDSCKTKKQFDATVGDWEKDKAKELLAKASSVWKAKMIKEVEQAKNPYPATVSAYEDGEQISNEIYDAYERCRQDILKGLKGEK